MDVRDILDETIELYKSNFGLFVGASALLYLPLYLLAALTPRSPETIEWPQTVVFLLATPLVSGALAWAASERFLNQAITPAAAYRPVLARFMAFFLTQVLVWLVFVLPYLAAAALAIVTAWTGSAAATGAVLLAGILPAMVASAIILVRTALTPQVQVLEDLHFLPALRRSRDLVAGYGWKVFAVLTVIGLLVLILNVALVAVPQGIAFTIAGLRGSEVPWTVRALLTLLSGLVTTVVAPLQLIALTLVYYDLRIRKEAFDLEALARVLESSYGTDAQP